MVAGRRRRPFDVGGPCFGIIEVDYLELIQDVIERIYNRSVQAPYMLPDVVPASAKPFECNGFAKRKMKRKKQRRMR